MLKLNVTRFTFGRHVLFLLITQNYNMKKYTEAQLVKIFKKYMPLEKAERVAWHCNCTGWDNYTERIIKRVKHEARGAILAAKLNIC